MNVPQILKLHSLKVVIYISQSHEKTNLIFFLFQWAEHFIKTETDYRIHIKVLTFFQEVRIYT